jgi:hypothetical protein
VKRKPGYYVFAGDTVIIGPCKTYSSAYHKYKRLEKKVEEIEKRQNE